MTTAAPARPGWTPAMTDAALGVAALYAGSLAYSLGMAVGEGRPLGYLTGGTAGIVIIAAAFAALGGFAVARARHEDGQARGRIAATGVPSGVRYDDEAALKLVKARAGRMWTYASVPAIFCVGTALTGQSAPHSAWWPALVAAPLTVTVLLRISTDRPGARARRFAALLGPS